ISLPPVSICGRRSREGYLPPTFSVIAAPKYSAEGCGSPYEYIPRATPSLIATSDKPMTANLRLQIEVCARKHTAALKLRRASNARATPSTPKSPQRWYAPAARLDDLQIPNYLHHESYLSLICLSR